MQTIKNAIFWIPAIILTMLVILPPVEEEE